MEAGFKEIEHTADWELHVWAPDMAGLLKQAALGMFSLAKVKLTQKPRVRKEIILPFTDRESLIVDFLMELLFIAEDEGIGIDSFKIFDEGNQWSFILEGMPILEFPKEIKAVTYHGIRVNEVESGLEVNIVFDV